MFKLLCTPGVDAKAEIVPFPGPVVTAAYCLRLQLDPEMIVIHMSDRPNGREEMGAFLRSVAQEAGLLAMVLDPQPVRKGPRPLPE